MTKKPKRVTIIRHEIKITSYRNEYTCPACKVNFYNGGPSKDVTRFICPCGQELIVNNRQVA